MAEVTNAGVFATTLDAEVAAINAEMEDEFGTGPDGIDTTAASYTGRQNPIVAARVVQAEDLLVELVNALNRNNAQGRFLDFIGTVLDEPRNPATPATIPALLYGVPGFDVGDRRVRYTRNATVWRVPVGTVIGANGTIAVDLVSDVAGTTLADGTTIEAWRDGTNFWVIVDTDTRFTAVESTDNYSPGLDVEGDPSYRIRLGFAGKGSGFGTLPGVQRAIARVAGVGAKVDNNRTLFPNANGVPAKSIESVVESGTDAAVAQAILDSYSDTAGFFGSTTVDAFDINGNPVPVSFTRVARVQIGWSATVDITGAETPLPDDADSVIKTALSDYTNGLVTGLDVIPAGGEAAIISALPDGSIPAGGLTLLVGLLGGALGVSPVPITSRQRARTNAEAQPAEVLGTEPQPFNMIVGWIFNFSANDGAAQSVTFVVADFETVSQASALEVATAINNRSTGIVAGTEGGALVIRTETSGATSSIEILTATTPAFLAEVGMSFGTTFGSDGDIAVSIIS